MKKNKKIFPDAAAFAERAAKYFSDCDNTVIFSAVCASCKKEDTKVDAPDAAGVGKKGETQTERVEGNVDLNGPNEQIPGSTTRY